MFHYCDVIIGANASQITNLKIVYSTVYSGADQRKHQSSASLAFVLGIHRKPVNSPHKWPATQKMFPFDDVSMCNDVFSSSLTCHCTNALTHSEGDKWAPVHKRPLHMHFPYWNIFNFKLNSIEIYSLWSDWLILSRHFADDIFQRNFLE